MYFIMRDQNIHTITPPELKGEKGWTELKIPYSFGIGRSFIIGDRSSDRIRAKYFKKDSDNSFAARIWFGPSTEGPPGHVHGGSMAAVLDEAMGISAWLSGHTVVSAKITVEYRKLLPLCTLATIEANVVSAEGKKVIAKGKLYDKDGTVYTESEGLFINVPTKKFREAIERQDCFQK